MKSIGAVMAISTLLSAVQAAEPAVDMAPLTVTASRTPERLDDVPVSVTAFTAADLRLSDADRVADVAGRVPNFRFYSVGSRRTALFYMRGVGSSGPNQPAVGTFLDDVYLEMTGFSDLDFFDAERVEILRGPQSALYGRNTEGGVVHLISRAPGAEPEGRLSLRLGERGLFEGTASLSGPLGGDVFGRAAGAVRLSDGFVDNEWLGTRADEIEQSAARAAVRWLGGGGWDVTLSVFADRDRDGGYALAPISQVRETPYTVRHNVDASHERDLWLAALRAEREGPAGTLLSVSSITDWSNRDLYDEDFSPADLLRLDDRDELRSVAQEFRWSARDDGSAWRWLGGLFFSAAERSDRDFRTFGPDAGRIGAPPGLVEDSLLDLDQWTAALYGQLRWRPVEAVRISAGLRYERQEQEAEGRTRRTLGGAPAGPDDPFRADLDTGEWLPEVRAAWDWTERASVYASAARGFRAGGFNNGAAGADATYDPEFAWSYELGIRARAFPRALDLRAAVFRMDLTDQQLIQFEPAGQSFYFRNAGKSVHRGAEIELGWQATPALRFEGAAGWIEAEFDEYEDPALGIEYDGNRVPFVPRWNWSAAVEWNQPLRADRRWIARAELTGLGDTTWDEANTVETGDTTLVNARTGFEFGRYGLFAFAENLADRDVLEAVYVFSGGEPIAQIGRPRTVGLQWTADF